MDTDSTTVINDAASNNNNNQERTDEFALAGNVREQLGGSNGIAYSGEEFRLYGDGIWKEINRLEIENRVGKEVERIYHVANIPPTFNRVKAVTNLLKSGTYVEMDEWDKYPGILVFKNLALDTSTMQTVDHNPEHRATISLPHEYDPSATAPTWGRVISDLLSEDERLFFQEFAGYCLTHSVKHQMALWLVGPPGGGKSTLIKGLETMLGKLSGSLRLQKLNSQFGLTKIIGKTLLTCTEIPKQHLKTTDILNALITGDTADVEVKFKDAFDYQNKAKFIWAMNSLPSLYEPNNGLFRRAKVLKVKGIPAEKQDVEVIDRVQLEGPGITNWALEGLKRLNERGHFTYPKSVQDATKAFKNENDLPAQFLKECCDRLEDKLFDTKTYKVKSSDLTRAFNEWAEGHKDWSQKALSAEWVRLGLIRAGTEGYPIRESDGVYWYGVRLLRDE